MKPVERTPIETYEAAFWRKPKWVLDSWKCANEFLPEHLIFSDHMRSAFKGYSSVMVFSHLKDVVDLFYKAYHFQMPVEEKIVTSLAKAIFEAFPLIFLPFKEIYQDLNRLDLIKKYPTISYLSSVAYICVSIPGMKKAYNSQDRVSSKLDFTANASLFVVASIDLLGRHAIVTLAPQVSAGFTAVKLTAQLASVIYKESLKPSTPEKLSFNLEYNPSYIPRL